MGFGILFLGYIFTVFDTGILFIDSISVVFMKALSILGWIIVTVGCGKLSKYIEKFYMAKAASATLFILSAGDVVCHCLVTYKGIEISIVLRTVIYLLYAMTYFLFHFYLFGALKDVTADTGLEKENKKAKKLFYLNTVFCAVNFVSYLGISDTLTAVRYLFFIFITVVNAAFIYTCYMWICLPEDVDMKTKSEKKAEQKEGKKRKNAEK